ncbi:MAG: SMP-30/gluconolactonase/LRE family protein [Planctomycetota bacterium]|jgi:sugar lactone lactonase YvrE
MRVRRELAFPLRRLLATIVAALCVWPAAGLWECSAQERPEPLKEPRLLVKLPEICPTPDGMALDADGNVILACPNYADQTHPAVLVRINRDNRARLYYQMPVHPETGVACPMGIAFGPDGDLFVADNQGWVKPNEKGRLLRVEMEDGRPAGVVVVADGMKHPNGVRVHGGHVYVTQSLLIEKPGEPLVSGVYRFKLGDEGVKVANSLEDKNLLVTFQTLDADCQYGADGLAFDGRGNLYVGNFGDAAIHKITFDARGVVASNTIFAQDDCMKSVDGICVDDAGNVYVADFSNNAVCVASPEGKVRVLAKSPDCDGSRGGLDQPGEPVLRGRELILSNFDMVTGPDKLNSGHDHPYTLSVIKLDD